MNAAGQNRHHLVIFLKARSVRPASHVGLASQARFVDGRTSGAFRAPTTLSGWYTLTSKVPSMWSPMTASTTACS